MAKSKSIDNNGERMVPEVHKGTLIYAEHMTRYLVAKDIVKNKIVLDIASGSGYGTKLLSESAKKVYGVEVDKETVAYAQKNFGSKNVEFLAGDAENIPLKDKSIDVVITLETLEHVKNYEKFISEIARVLKPDGLAIISTPNDLEFAEGNHFHLHEFTLEELSLLLKKYFKNLKPYFQATWKFVAIGDEKTFTKERLTNLELLNYSPPKKEEYLYFYILCSQRDILEQISPLGALGGHYSDRALIGAEMNHEQNILNYKNVLNESKLANEKLANDLEIAHNELSAIRSKLAYRAASKVSRTTRKVFRQNNSK